MNRGETVLAVDPGRFKCGIAVVRGDAAQAFAPPTILHREIVETAYLAGRTRELLATHAIAVVLIGDATTGKALARALRAVVPAEIPIEMAPEAFTSQRARARYCRENPAVGWRRLLPAGLRTPPVPYDDYVAVLLAEDWFAARESTDAAS